MMFCKYFVGLLSVMLWPSNITAQTSSRTVKEGNRTIVEETNNNDGKLFYYYTVNDISNRVNALKQRKIEFNYKAEYPYPIRNNPQLMKKEFHELDQLCLSCFSKNAKNMKPKEILCYNKALIDDDGSVICYKIIAKTPLLELFTAKELLNIFDTINSFRFTTPLMKYESTGYLEATLGYF
ncbi:hypothetical protein [Xylanibacter ruminicola]|uniref:TonB protein C-terminal n=1 Tax=Xylanibacter ruminicola TaxID=839 RepID=A0A1M6SS05_XYLRU|nr:hypothetical protein [Xylanibacter ruminicola]SHK47427.1 hypothetical protein SAMN05216463_1044 [Xylanibacter ruminicola]